MSRIGKQPVPIPQGVDVRVAPAAVTVKGPKGQLEVPVPEGIEVVIESGEAVVARRDDSKPQKSLHGLTRALLANAVHGVSQGFERVLQIVGTGYRAELSGQKLTLQLGYSHPVEFDLPAGVAAKVERNTITLSGYDKQLLGQVAADLRKLRPPDAYKGKGVRYQEERISLKAGKAAGA